MSLDIPQTDPNSTYFSKDDINSFIQIVQAVSAQTGNNTPITLSEEQAALILLMNKSQREVFKHLPEGVDYLVQPSDLGKTLVPSGVMEVIIPSDLGGGFFCTVTKYDALLQMFDKVGTYAWGITDPATLTMDTPFSSVLVRIDAEAELILLEGKLVE